MFGKPQRIRKRNADGNLFVDRHYGYNAYQELCRSEEPETGTTLMGYDTAGNLKWSSSGLPTGQACEPNGTTTAVAARRSDRTYNNRNRLQDLAFPGGSGNQTWQYWPDGLPYKITTHNDGLNAGIVENTYAYNKRRMLTGESSTQLGWYTWGIGYGPSRGATIRGLPSPRDALSGSAPSLSKTSTVSRLRERTAWISGVPSSSTRASTSTLPWIVFGLARDGMEIHWAGVGVESPTLQCAHDAPPDSP